MRLDSQERFTALSIGVPATTFWSATPGFNGLQAKSRLWRIRENMGGKLVFSENAFANWAAFERQLRGFLQAEFSPDATNRVLARTQRAVNKLQLIDVARRFVSQNAAQVVRYEMNIRDRQAVRMRMLAALINSFVALERPRK